MSGEIEYSGGRGRRSHDPKSPTGFEATDRALRRYLERRKRLLEKARAEGVLDELLKLERAEAEIEAKRRAEADRRERERADRAERERRAAFLRRRGRTADDRRADRVHMQAELERVGQGSKRT